MAIPALPFLIKFLLLKVIKGAAVGMIRFVRRLSHKSKTADKEAKLNTQTRSKFAIGNEWRKRDNLVYLILMLSNAIYGFQELVVLLWRFLAKRLFNEYCAAVPAGFEMPEQFCDRVHHLPMPKLIVACLKWVGMAALIYWPKTHETLSITLSTDERWAEVRWKRLVYLVRIDKKRSITYRRMTISSDGSGAVDITTSCGQYASLP